MRICISAALVYVCVYGFFGAYNVLVLRARRVDHVVYSVIDVSSSKTVDCCPFHCYDAIISARSSVQILLGENEYTDF